MNNNYITVIDFYMFYRRCKLTQNWKISCLFRMIILTKKGFPPFNKSTYGELYLSKITWQSWYVFLLVIYHWKWNVQYKRKIALLFFLTLLAYQRNVVHKKMGGKSLKIHPVFTISYPCALCCYYFCIIIIAR